MNAQVLPLRPEKPGQAPAIIQATRRARSAIALLGAGCPSLARHELLRAAEALEASQDAPLRCLECCGTGFDEDARCDVCDGTGLEGATRA